MSTPLRSGLIDYDPTRGHATLFKHLIRDREITHHCQLTGYFGLKDAPAHTWCETRDVHLYSSFEEMQGNVDAIVIPASSDPETHEELFGLASELRTPVYIDKPLAATLDAGLRLQETAARLNIPLTSSSALRFAAEATKAKSKFPCPRFLEVWGGCSDRPDEFLIHPVELSITLMGELPSGFRHLRPEAGITSYEFQYPSGARSTVVFHPGNQAYEFTIADDKQWEHHTIRLPFFIGLINHVIAFFRTGQSVIPPQETAAILQIIDLARNMQDQQTLEIPSLCPR